MPKSLNRKSIYRGFYKKRSNQKKKFKELLNFSWASSRFDREVVWLISWFVWFRWRKFESDGSNIINGRELFGFLRFKYKEALHKNLLSPIPGLLKTRSRVVRDCESAKVKDGLCIFGRKTSGFCVWNKFAYLLCSC